ncbi:hypothetical protein COLO4_37743 [Corchorus olitorius]|uniref:Uncharacterized protein n=1 Tax=Corchorus olitorius TaxID=93759 RepID=A0A1R3FZM6_9ROSI|nr:hypothetical protein COLO4_37743 [Corchorus olitorius]
MVCLHFNLGCSGLGFNLCLRSPLGRLEEGFVGVRRRDLGVYMAFGVFVSEAWEEERRHFGAVWRRRKAPVSGIREVYGGFIKERKMKL